MLEDGGEEVSADEADPDDPEYMPGDFNTSMISICSIITTATIIMVTVWMFREKDPGGWNTWP